VSRLQQVAEDVYDVLICIDMCKSAPHRYASRLYAKQNKRASFLGVPVAFLQQLAVCGRCTVCEAFAKAWWKFLARF